MDELRVTEAKIAGKGEPEKGCASSKVATAGGAIGGRAGTGGHFQF
jgi:hypothetical protein